MKKLILPFMALILSANVFVSCSNEDVNTTDVIGENTNVTKKINLATNNYLRKFYGKSVTYGQSINTMGENGITLTVSEVFVPGSSSPRGYVVNRTSDSKLLYFADFNTVTNNMTAIDVVTNETNVMGGLNTNQYYLASGGDILEIVKAVNNTAANGFFGWISWVFTMDNFWGTTIEPTGPCTDELQPNGTVISSQPIETSHRVLWIRWSSPKPGRKLC